MSAPALSPVTQQAHDYLTAVERELDDLPAEERTALVEDLALHLEALATEDDDRPVAVRLGPPAAYAADLRSAAGLPARNTGPQNRSAGLRDRWDAVLATPAAQRVLPAGREVRLVVRELRPAWWVLRGYLLVLVPCLLDPYYVRHLPVPAPLGSRLLGVVLVLAAVTASVIVGRRKLPRAGEVAVAAAGVVLVLASAVLGKSVWDGVRQDYAFAASPAFMPPAEQATGQYPLLSRYGPVTDVFPYAADGTPLEGVLLYDQDGRPLRVGLQEWWADECFRVLEQPLAADGVPVPHSFPQNYELFGAGVDIHTAQEVPGRCAAEVQRPDVPLPTFAAADGTAAASTASAPGD